MTADTSRELVKIVLANPAIRAIWENWDRLELPDCWLVAGCVAHTVWNHRFGLPVATGIADIDLVYFDPDDLWRHRSKITPSACGGSFQALACGSTSRTRRGCIFGMSRGSASRSRPNGR